VLKNVAGMHSLIFDEFISDQKENDILITEPSKSKKSGLSSKGIY
jgi:hypothetical protein